MNEMQPGVDILNTLSRREIGMFRHFANQSKGARIYAETYKHTDKPTDCTPVVALITGVGQKDEQFHCRPITVTELDSGETEVISAALSMSDKDLTEWHGHPYHWMPIDAAEQGDVVIILKENGYKQEKKDFFDKKRKGVIADNVMLVITYTPVELYRKILSEDGKSKWVHVAQYYNHVGGDKRNKKRPWPGLPTVKSPPVEK